MEISDEEIYELREQGLTYQAISEYFISQERKISISTIFIRCKKIYEEKGEKVPNANTQSKISDEEIYELREQGLTYQAIEEYFVKQGKNANMYTIKYRCKKIYKSKGQNEPKSKRKAHKTKTGITDEEIYELREQGLNYVEIAEYFTNQGKSITNSAIWQRSKRIYKAKGQEPPKAKIKGDEKIYELREQGLSYKEISEYFIKQGKEIPYETIRYRSKKTYKQKGQDEPKAKLRTGITDEEIYELREQGLSYKEISEYFIKQGRKISWQSINTRCKKIYREKGQEEPKLKKGPQAKRVNTTEEKQYPQREINKNDLEKEIVNLIVTKKASLEQIKKLADIYEVDLRKILNNLGNER